MSPAWLTWICLLWGRRPPAVEDGFTYCELGCGTGLTITALAASHPRGRFWGFDFNPGHIADGRALADAAKIGNVTLEEGSFADLAAGIGPDLPPMDFIVLHGVYTWVTAEHRAAIVRFIDRRLKPGGIVYVSYNCLPGWATVQPLQRLFRDGGATTPGGTAARLRAGVGLAEKLRKAEAAFFVVNPTAGRQLDEMAGDDPAYLSHEYLNEGSTALYHAEVADDLAAAKLGYVGSAAVGENFDGLMMTDEQRALIAEQPDPLLARTARDYHVNTRFRRDVFQRGDATIGGIEQRERISALGLALIVPRAVASAAFKGTRKPMSGNPETYGAVFDALADGPRRIGAILADPRVGNLTVPQMIEIGSMMINAGQIHPVLGARDPQTALHGTRALNVALVRAAMHSSPVDVLAAPAIGGAVLVDFVDTIAVGALMDPPDAEPTMESLSPLIRGVMRSIGRRLVVDKRVMADEAENDAEADLRLSTFLSQRLPLYRQLGIL